MIIKAIIFDLVGVLLDFCGPEKVLELSEGRIGDAKFGKFWVESEWALRFSQGTCSSEEFAKGAVAYFGLNIESEAFLENYRSWYQGPYPGALELVIYLKQNYKIGCLSNINEIYTPRFRQELRLHEIMDDCVFSNEVGMIKPGTDIYFLAARRLGFGMNNILFLDDSQPNVDAALSSGMLAWRVDRPDGARQALMEFGLITETRGIILE
jgi:glucose-1-phosphatase